MPYNGSARARDDALEQGEATQLTGYSSAIEGGGELDEILNLPLRSRSRDVEARHIQEADGMGLMHLVRPTTRIVTCTALVLLAVVFVCRQAGTGSSASADGRLGAVAEMGTRLDALAPGGSCQDSVTYRDPQYDSTCDRWRDFPCSPSSTWLGADYSEELRSHCPVTCGACGALVGTPAGRRGHRGGPGSCAAAGENCSASMCCSDEGHTCFRKNSTWAGCRATCSEDVIHMADFTSWNCTALSTSGAEKPLSIPKKTEEQVKRTEGANLTCSWDGEDCRHTRCCNRPGKRCFLKNKYYATCMDQWSCPSGMVDKKDGTVWNCTELGSSVAAAPAVKAAPKGEEAGTSLFCFEAIMPGSYEEWIVKEQHKSRLSVFACDHWAIYKGFPAERIAQGSWVSFVNTEAFMKVWTAVQDDGQYLKADWTVKVDPDAVFYPDRLVNHLWSLRPPRHEPLYLRNMPFSEAPSQFGFLGPLEVFSREAVEVFFKKRGQCVANIGYHSGEDNFMKVCMDVVGAGFMADFGLLDIADQMGHCADASKVAFHAFKSPEAWMGCYNMGPHKVNARMLQ